MKTRSVIQPGEGCVPEERLTCRTSISQSYAEFYVELRRSYGEKAGLGFVPRSRSERLGNSPP